MEKFSKLLPMMNHAQSNITEYEGKLYLDTVFLFLLSD